MQYQKGETIILRPITKKDTKKIVEWRNNDRVFQNFIFSEKFTEDMHNHWMDTKVKSGEVVQFIICVRETNKEIGSVYFRDIDYKKGVAEYGIFIGDDAETGKGYGKEAAKLALEYAFNVLDLKMIFLRVFADNVSAVSSYKAAGFVETEYRKSAVEKDGKLRDLIFMEKHKYAGNERKE